MGNLDKGLPFNAKYDGYTSCPIVLGRKELLLAEFKYDGNLAESFSKFPYSLFPFMNQDKAQYFFSLVKHFVFPFVYWNFHLKGYWFGPNLIFRPTYPALAENSVKTKSKNNISAMDKTVLCL